MTGKDIEFLLALERPFGVDARGAVVTSGLQFCRDSSGPKLSPPPPRLPLAAKRVEQLETLSRLVREFGLR